MVAAQRDDSSSFLSLYRAALALRNRRWRDAGPPHWLESSDGVLALRRGDLGCWVNTSERPVTLPDGLSVLLGSVPDAVARSGKELAPDAAVWVQIAPTAP